MTQKPNQLFRLAAVLYADNNYEVTPKTIHKKIIESALLDNDNKQLSLHKLIDFIHDNYSINFDENEVLGIVDNEKDDAFLVKKREDDLLVCLSEKRKATLRNKLSNKTIDYFICEFVSQHDSLVVGTDVKQLIYRFLYELLTTNIASFSKLIDRNKNFEDLINVEAGSYSPIDREIINSFLSWDNNDKNKAIFDIASYALEYCLISNDNVGTSVHLASLRNKVFYLDTNVIYRVLGINGKNRQNRTRTFLKKFVEVGESLTISKFTELEFKESIKFYVDKLKKHPLHKLNPEVFQERYFQSLSSVFDFYHQWRVGKMNDSYDLFEAHIFSTYEQFKKEFNIIVDYKIPFDLTDETQKNQIEELAKDISSFKTSEEARHGYESDFNDACNIHLIDLKRNGNNQNLFDSKYFFISTDQSLRRWDFRRSTVTPIVILPSQWLSILLRYIRRTNDDFKSFVSFLNLPNPETNISGEKLHIILSGISEITQDFQQQQFLAHTLVQNKFEGILENGVRDEQILEKTKEVAKTLLSQNLQAVTEKHTKLANRHGQLKEEYETHKQITQNKLSALALETIEKQNKLIIEEEKAQTLKKAFKKQFVDTKIAKWRVPAYFALTGGLLLVAFMFFQFCFTDLPYNIASQLVTSIDNLNSDTRKDTLRALMYAPIGGIAWCAIFCWNRFISGEKIESKKKALSKQFDEEHS